ncbi:FKBP-type peptidyl-prolyl cis-trans isomerase N-terminal domain-containing protein [Ancylomarina sp. YFZ004]
MFLNEHKSKPGVVTTQSGLQYKILISGTVLIQPRIRK